MDKIQPFLTTPVTYQAFVIIIVITLLFVWQFNKYWYAKHIPIPATGQHGAIDLSYSEAKGSGAIVDDPPPQ